MWQPGWRGGLGDNGYMHTYGWDPSLFTWDYHNIVNWLHIPQCEMFFVLKKKYHSSPVGVAIDHPHFHLSPIRENLTWKKKTIFVYYFMQWIYWRRAWQPTPVSLPGECHEQRSLADYSPWGCRVRHDWSDLAHMHAVKIQFIRPFYVNGYWGCSQFFPSQVTLLWTPSSRMSAQSCLTLCDLMDLPDSSVCGIIPARILEWVTISFSRGSLRPQDWTCSSCIEPPI